MTTVLVVDDEPLVRDVVTRYLERDGHRVITADGRIGGFSAPGGVDTKDRLHRLEGIVLATDAPLLRLMA